MSGAAVTHLRSYAGGLLLLILTACGATAPADTTAGTDAADPPAAAPVPADSGVPTAPAVAATSAPVDAATASGEPQATAVAGLPGGPVTAIMERLKLTGEPYATQGDPNAPLTVVEFSDYG